MIDELSEESAGLRSKHICCLEMYLSIVYKITTHPKHSETSLQVQKPYNSFANYPLVMDSMKESCKMRLALLNHSMEELYENFGDGD